jgi:hypothetical protein
VGIVVVVERDRIRAANSANKLTASVSSGSITGQMQSDVVP